MGLSLFAIFISSLVGSAHCLGMCGGLAAAAHNRSKSSIWSYQLGRLLTYSLFGALAGGFGAVITAISPSLIILFAGALLIYGIAGLSGYTRRILPTFLAKKISKLISMNKDSGSFIIGLLTGLLPCGWLYSFISIATVQGSSINGAAVLTAFWAGTLPWLAGPAILMRKVVSPKSAMAIVYIMMAFSGGLIITQKTYGYFKHEVTTANSCH